MEPAKKTNSRPRTTKSADSGSSLSSFVPCVPVFFLLLKTLLTSFLSSPASRRSPARSPRPSTRPPCLPLRVADRTSSIALSLVPSSVPKPTAVSAPTPSSPSTTTTTSALTATAPAPALQRLPARHPSAKGVVGEGELRVGSRDEREQGGAWSLIPRGKAGSRVCDERRRATTSERDWCRRDGSGGQGIPQTAERGREPRPECHLF